MPTDYTHFYDFGDTDCYPGSGTTVTDLGSGGSTGTMNGGVTYSGSNGGYMSFDGTDDYISLASFSPELDDYSLGAWVYFNSIISNTNLRPSIWFCGSGGSPNDVNFDLRIYSTFADKKGALSWISSSTENRIFDTVDMPTGTWVHLMATMDITGASNPLVKLYRNGSVVSTTLYHTNNPGYSGGSFQTNLGQSLVGASRFMNGRIALPVHYNRKLSDSEVLACYNEHLSRF